MTKDQPKAVRTTRNRTEAMAAMEPRLRELHRAATPATPGSQSGSARVGRIPMQFEVDGQEVRFWMRHNYTIVFAGVLDPAKPGQYCDGRVHISNWVRGEWEADLGAKVELFNPLTTGVLPTKLINQIRTGLKRWPVLAPDSEEAFKTIVACLDEPFDSMLQSVLARKEAADAQLDTVLRCVPHPNFAVAVALVLALNMARPSSRGPGMGDCV
jgi:hypothetical protein